MEREERPLADLDQHVRELLLDELEGGYGPSELLPLFRVSQCGLVAVPRRPHRAPDDAVSGLAQAGEWSAEAPGFRQHCALREADVLEPDVALDRSPHGELGRYICGREAFRVCRNEKASDRVLLFVSARPDYGDIGDGGQPDPTLLPFQDPVGAVLPGEGLHARRVWAGVRLGEAETADSLSSRHRRQPPLFLVLRSELVDGAHGE